MTVNADSQSRSRLTVAHLRRLASEIPARDIAVLAHLACVRSLTGAQLDRLLHDPEVSGATTARVRRRILARLVQLGLVTTLHRRIGGVRAGSAGHVYTLTGSGYRFLAISREEPLPSRIRHTRTPGAAFLDHTLAVSDLYVQLIDTSRALPSLSVSRFVTEPDCWFPTSNGDWLRPDGYVVLDAGGYRDCWWVEVDRGSESLSRIRAKCRAYLDHATGGGTGPDQVLPRVLFTAPEQRRMDAIQDVIRRSTAPDTPRPQ